LFVRKFVGTCMGLTKLSRMRPDLSLLALSLAVSFLSLSCDQKSENPSGQRPPGSKSAKAPQAKREAGDHPSKVEEERLSTDKRRVASAKQSLEAGDSAELKKIVADVRVEGLRGSLLQELALNVKPESAALLADCILEFISPDDRDGPMGELVKTLAAQDLRTCAEVLTKIPPGSADRLRENCLQSLGRGAASSGLDDAFPRIRAAMNLEAGDYRELQLGVATNMATTNPDQVAMYLQSSDPDLAAAARIATMQQEQRQR
jgi:hypothetical protein